MSSPHQDRECEMGIIYIVLGPAYLPEAISSATSAKKFVPDIDISLFTDQIVKPSAIFNKVLNITDSHNGFEAKINCMAKSPYNKTLLLDTDTYICGDIRDIFEILNNFHFVAAHSQRRRHFQTNRIPLSFTAFNSGVVAFRKDTVTTNFFSEWLLNYNNILQSDFVENPILNEPSLHLSLFESQLRIATLPNEYHCRFLEIGHLSGQVKILHGRLPSINWQKIASVVNSSLVDRAFVSGKLFVPKPNGEISSIDLF